MEIAAKKSIKFNGRFWIVPSQTGKRKNYQVILENSRSCSCPDYEFTGKPCKHIFAAEFTMKQEFHVDGSTSTTKTVKVSYSQNWPAYNAAQTQEREYFNLLLSSLCKTLPEPPRKAGDSPGGRKPLPYSDMTFAATYKIYSTFSARRFSTDLREAHEKGLISKVPHFNSVLNHLERPDLTTNLQKLIIESSKPMSSLETKFAVDSSGFTTSRKNAYYDMKYSPSRHGWQGEHANYWVKCHIMTGVKTNIVTSCEVNRSGDHTMLPPMVKATAENFHIQEVLADKGYRSRKNFELVDSLGGIALIPFSDKNVLSKNNELWNKLYHYFSFNREEFMDRYHMRSNVESTFSAIKAKFGGHVRSKGPKAQENEVLAKVLCHNICCLIHSMFEFGISPKFSGQ